MPLGAVPQQQGTSTPFALRPARDRMHPDNDHRIDDQTGGPLPNRNETNVRVDYAIGKGTFLEGLVATFRYSWLRQDGSPQTGTQLRAYLNYAVRF